MKSCYGNFVGATKNIMLWEIMLWKDHVRRGLAVHDGIYGLFFPNGKWRHNGRFGSFFPPQYIIPSSMFQGSVKISVVVVVLAVVDVISIWLFVVG